MNRSVCWKLAIVAACAACAALAAGAVGGCAQPIEQGLQSDTDSARIDACVRAGESGDPCYAPLLIELLDVPSADVRFYAICALERVTGCRYEYCYHGSPDRIAAQTRRIRRLWVTSRRRPGG